MSVSGLKSFITPGNPHLFAMVCTANFTSMSSASILCFSSNTLWTMPWALLVVRSISALLNVPKGKGIHSGTRWGGFASKAHATCLRPCSCWF